MHTWIRPRPSALVAAALGLALVTVIVGTAAPAWAGPLAPGQSGAGQAFVLNELDPSFQGQTLASTSTPFEVTEVDPDTGFSEFFRGTFNHRVVRESATGRLAFHYEFLRGLSNGILDYENFVVGSFAGFETDVFSDQTSLTTGAASRSADGTTIDFIGDEESPAHLVVRTNATDFAQTGTATLIAAFQPDGEFQQIPFTAFAPAADDPGPTPNPIPLPPAAWATLAAVGGLGAAKRLRRRG